MMSSSEDSRFQMNRVLTEKTRQKAEKELRETPELQKQACEELRKMLQENNTLYYRTDDDMLIRFLRPCKYYVKSAFELMKRAADFKVKYNIGDLTPQKVQKPFCEEDIVNVLVNTDQHGRRVLLTHLGSKWNTSKVTADNIFEMCYIMHQAAMIEPETQINGLVIVMDFNGLSFSQISALSPAFSIKLLTFIQDAMPLRLKEVHIVNQPFIFNMIYAMFKPFIREKLKKRMFFHAKDRKSFQKHIDPDYLPAEYGGKLPAMDYSSKNWYPAIADLEPEIKEWNSFGWQK